MGKGFGVGFRIRVGFWVRGGGSRVLLQHIGAPPQVVRSLGKKLCTHLCRNVSQRGVGVLGLDFEFGSNFGLGL